MPTLPLILLAGNLRAYPSVNEEVGTWSSEGMSISVVCCLLSPIDVSQDQQMLTSDLDYSLPDDLISTKAVEPRDSARLLVCSRRDRQLLEHATFRDLPKFLQAPDILVLNQSRVIPARIWGVRAQSGGKIDGLFLEEGPLGVWKVLLRSNGRMRTGDQIRLGSQAKLSKWSLTLLDFSEGAWRVDLSRQGQPAAVLAQNVLEEIGTTPLPPYILAARRSRGEIAGDDRSDREAYQAVYAEESAAGSIAAPTAGLHFTPGLLSELNAHGVTNRRVTLHVGVGTFKPVATNRLEDHPMHAEQVEVSAATISAIEDCRNRGGRCICVGTTSVRAIETVPVGGQGYVGPTDLLIQPGYGFKWTDGLITNFHLPRSTLLALVGGLFPDGLARLLELYREAIRLRYRFYSFGDAMLILP